MERPNKKHKPNDYPSHNEEHNVGVVSQDRLNHGQTSNQFNGVGIQSHNSNFTAGRDVIINSHAPNPSNDRDHEARQAVLDSLKFEQMDARQQSIKRAHAKTCRWFLKTPEYKTWLNVNKTQEHRGFLWVRGKPGAGKSTLMRLALDHTYRAFKSTGTCILSFFFNARGSELEKSTTGLYRALLVQLFKARPDAMHVLDSVHIGHQWNIESLKHIFEQAVQSIGKQQLICFIDALDECGEQEIRDMVSFLSELSWDENPLHVCFASRHFPYITIRKSLSLVLEDQEEHGRDISSYLDHALYFEDDPGLADQIRADLQKKASGIFMWIVLVVDILNREYDAGRKHSLREKLRQIPGDLHALFRDMLTREGKPDDGLLLCIQWVLFARQPLSPRQLYFAILSGLDPTHLVQCHGQEISDNHIRKYILSNSKGLAEATNSKLPTVQFIHESVRDFLLKENGLARIWPHMRTNLEGHSQEALKQTCALYIDAVTHILQSILPDELPKASSEEAAELRKSVDQRFPFLKYSNGSLLYHADQAGGNGIKQESFLARLRFAKWIQQHNIFEAHAIRRYSSNVSLLYVLAENNLAALIKAASSKQSCFDVEEDRYGAPIFAALATKSQAAIRSLLDNQTRSESTAHVEIQSQPTQNRETQSDFNSLSRTFAFSRQRGVLSHLVELGDINILSKYLSGESNTVNDRCRQGRTPLFFAVENCYCTISQLLIEHGADVNIANHDGDTPLLQASLNGQTDIAKLLIEHGANVNIANRYGKTPLLQASLNGHTDIAKLLIEHGADINIADQNGEKPIFLAASYRHIDVVTLLVEHGADVNITDGSRQTPLFWASSNRHTDVAKLLIEHGAAVNTTDDHGKTPLLQASSNGYIDVVKLLIEHGAEVNITDDHGRTPLLRAYLNKHVDVARLLIERGAEVNFTDEDGRTLLSQASSFEHMDIVNLLIERGAEVNITDKYRRTLLLRASLNGHVGFTQLLIERGVDVNIANQDGDTPLLQASSNGHIDVAKLLVEHGADVNMANRYGKTPLFQASSKALIYVAKLLCDYGADVNIASKYGKAPLYDTFSNAHLDIVELLVEHGGHVHTGVTNQDREMPLYYDFANGYINTAKLLVDLGADVNIADKSGRTPLFWAASNGHTDLAKLLIEHGADMNITNKYGKTPLFWASWNGHIEVVKLLIDHGAEVNITNQEGETPLFRASSNGHTDIAKLLIKHGADVNFRSQNGRTSLFWATSNRHTDVAELLIEHGAEMNIVDHSA